MSVKDEIEKLRLDSRFGKDKHFIAADRMRSYHYWLGLPLIGISVFLGSAVFTEVFSHSKQAQILGAILAFISALMALLQTFLNPKEMEKGHRSIGDRYLKISRNCRLLTARLNDGIVVLQQASEEYFVILKAYSETNIEAEAFPISRRDFNLANQKSQSKVT